MTVTQAVVLFVAGLLTGIINTMAGGGSLISLPVLMFAGLPAHVANGTNRIGVLIGSITASADFRRSGALRGVGWVELGPAVVGAILGSMVSLDVDEEVFRRAVGIMMLVMLATVLVDTKTWLEGRATSLPAWGRALVFLGIGLYGGFLQAGVGVLLLAGFVLASGRDLVAANVQKVVIVGVFTVPVLVVFVWHGAVWWGPGLALAAGSALGGVVGARMTVRGGARLVRGVLIAVVLVSSGRLLGLW